MKDESRMGLGSERKYGINRNKYDDFDLDSFLDKAKKAIRSTTDKEKLEKIQKKLDTVADKYKDKCTKKQLGKMYSLQSDIYNATGDKKLAKAFKAESTSLNGSYSLILKILSVCLVITVVIAVVTGINDSNQAKQRKEEALNECLSHAKSSAHSSASLDVNNAGIDSESDTKGVRDKLYNRLYTRYYNEYIIKCNEENKTDKSEENINNANKAIQDAENSWQSFLNDWDKEIQANKEYAQQLILESIRNNKSLHCTSHGYGSYISTDCY
ncbi:MAG: hypothetical protein IKB97_09725 [Bacteroidaceae bacterium]|nr:hypothetical protein [Bacteroidaceae bacterium]